jgi:AcrR family transcriptional regulator
MDAMADEERRLRADAERNRRRLLDAARELLDERGLEVSVGEIAEAAGVGRGTLFRNFPSKEHLIAAIVAEQMQDAAARGRELLEDPNAGGALFEFVEELVGRQQQDRALFEAVAPEFLANDEIRAAHAEIIGVFDQLIDRAKQAGAVRQDIGAVDLLMMLKGVMEAATAFSQTNPEIVDRQLDLVRAAISVPAAVEPLRGRAPTIEDIEQAHTVEESLSRAKRARS